MLPLSICRVSPLCSGLYELRLSTKCVLYRYFTEYIFFLSTSVVVVAIAAVAAVAAGACSLDSFFFGSFAVVHFIRTFVSGNAAKKEGIHQTQPNGYYIAIFIHTLRERASVVVNSRSLRCRHHHIEAN